jgi:hypothetical protein
VFRFHGLGPSPADVSGGVPPLICPGIHYRDPGPQSAPVQALGGALVCVAIAAATLLSRGNQSRSLLICGVSVLASAL